MAELKEEVTATQQAGVAEDGSVVQRQTRRVENTAGPKTTVANIVWFIYGVIAILLVLRFVLKLTGANSVNGFVSFIYSVTNFLSAPFDSIFGTASVNTQTTSSVFEPSIIVAIVVYALIAWGITKLLQINQPKNTI
jgi:hypothetical protein